MSTDIVLKQVTQSCSNNSYTLQGDVLVTLLDNGMTIFEEVDELFIDLHCEES